MYIRSKHRSTGIPVPVPVPEEHFCPGSGTGTKMLFRYGTGTKMLFRYRNRNSGRSIVRKPSRLFALAFFPPCSILTYPFRLTPVLQLDKSFLLLSCCTCIVFVPCARVTKFLTKIPVTLRRIYANVHLLLSLSGVKVICSL